MVGFITLPKVCVLAAFGLCATVGCNDIAQEQPKRESLDSGFFHKNDKPSTGLPKVEEPPMYSVEWHLLPKPENRKHLRYRLPYDLAKDVPIDCDEPIDAALEKRIRKFFSLRGLIFTSMSSYPGLDETNNVGQTTQGSLDSSSFDKTDELTTESHDISEPTNTDAQENTNEEEPPMYSVEWHLLPKQENRDALRSFMPCYLAEDVPEDCNEPISSKLEKRIREHFSWIEQRTVTHSYTANSDSMNVGNPMKSSKVNGFSGTKGEPTTEPHDAPEATKTNTQENTDEEEPPMYSVEWLLLPKPENRKHLRYRLPYDLAKFLPSNCHKPIKPFLEKRIRKFFLLSEQEQQSKRRRFILPLYLKTKLGIS